MRGLKSGPLGALLVSATLGLGCNTAGSDWMAQPLEGELTTPTPPSAEQQPRATPPAGRSRRTHVIADTPPPDSSTSSLVAGATTEPPKSISLKLGAGDGTLLGTFKNTYYDFPSEGDFEGERVSLMSTSCKPIAEVARGFYESVCVQGSGTLKAGGTVSFAKRDCACAELCPRSGQRICFDLLDRAQFPWGRGATGKPITPLLTVAVDSAVIPLGTPLYIPEYDGTPRDGSGSSRHDGCFLAEDRGLAVKGQHVDVFTGYSEVTRLWNRLVPTGKGVTVVLDSPRCKRVSPR